MKTVKKASDYRKDETARTAGGFGVFAAKQSPEALLRRSVMANLLWEDNFYEDGVSVSNNIIRLIPKVDPDTVAEIVLEAKFKQKLRHIPLFITRHMAKIDTHKKYVADLLEKIITRPDDLVEFVSLYWLDGKQPLSAQVKKGLARSFAKFDEYQLAKYNRKTNIKLRDVAFLTHPKINDREKAITMAKLLNKNYYPYDVSERLSIENYEPLKTPDTWEVALSSGADKKETWERLITTNKLGALAFLRNLRNMEIADVERDIILKGFENLNTRWLLPLNFLAAAKAAPSFEREIEDTMFRSFSQSEKLPGLSVFVVDVSGSMHMKISAKGNFTRIDVAAVMAMIASEMCEHIVVYATAGSDYERTHKTEKLIPRRGFALIDEIKNKQGRALGGGGIYTRQCLEYIKNDLRTIPERIIVFSDSQDCDTPDSGVARPFGLKNYIIDVSAHSRGINYDNLWTAEISGWSEHFLNFIMAYEGLEVDNIH